MIMNPMKLDTSFSSSTSTNNNNEDCSFWPIRTTTAAATTATTMASTMKQQQQQQQQQQQNLKVVEKKKNLSKVKLPFPLKLHTLLEDLEVEGLDDIACWLPNGKSFRINNPERFSSEVMKNYFRQSKYTSFVRQLYIYGFAKYDEGCHCGGGIIEVGAYHHPQFMKNNRSLCLTLGRNQIISDRRCKKNPNCKKTVVKVMNATKAAKAKANSNNKPYSSAAAAAAVVSSNSFSLEGSFVVPDLSFSTATKNTTSSSSSFLRQPFNINNNNNSDLFDLSRIFVDDQDNNDVTLPSLASSSSNNNNNNMYDMFDLEPRPIEMMMS